MDYLATMTYVNALMLSTMTDENKKYYFRIIRPQKKLGLIFYVKTFLKRIEFTQSGTFNSTNKQFQLLNASYVIKSMSICSRQPPEDNVNGIDVECGPMQILHQEHPTNCKW